MHYLRWLCACFLGLALIPATPWLAWTLDASMARWLCPSSQLISGVCMAPWFGPLGTAVMCSVFALGAAALVALPALLAPSERRLVVHTTFILGAVLMSVVVLVAGLGGLAFAAPALAGGYLARALLLRRLPQ